jgi:ABC-2 type transport system ATP-binding protein
MNIEDEDPAIELIHVFKSYAKPVLKDISLKIARGSVVGYIGANGAGKSTTVKILTGLITHFEGVVNVLGKDFRENTLELKKKIGYIPENAALYEMLTPVEYLHFIGGLYGLAEEVLADRIHKMLRIFGMQEVLHQRMDGFSKGMKQ